MALELLIRILAATVRVPNVTTNEVGNGYGRDFRHCILFSRTLALLWVLCWYVRLRPLFVLMNLVDIEHRPGLPYVVPRRNSR